MSSQDHFQELQFRVKCKELFLDNKGKINSLYFAISFKLALLHEIRIRVVGHHVACLLLILILACVFCAQEKKH